MKSDQQKTSDSEIEANQGDCFAFVRQLALQCAVDSTYTI